MKESKEEERNQRKRENNKMCSFVSLQVSFAVFLFSSFSFCKGMLSEQY